MNDEAGAIIMQVFYKAMRSGVSKDEALRQAKLNFLNEADNLTASPFYWSNYILIGDTSVIDLPEKQQAALSLQHLSILLIVLMLIFLTFRIFKRKGLHPKPLAS